MLGTRRPFGIFGALLILLSPAGVSPSNAAPRRPPQPVYASAYDDSREILFGRDKKMPTFLIEVDRKTAPAGEPIRLKFVVHNPHKVAVPFWPLREEWRTGMAAPQVWVHISPKNGGGGSYYSPRELTAFVPWEINDPPVMLAPGQRRELVVKDSYFGQVDQEVRVRLPGDYQVWVDYTVPYVRKKVGDEDAEEQTLLRSFTCKKLNLKFTGKPVKEPPEGFEFQKTDDVVILRKRPSYGDYLAQRFLNRKEIADKDAVTRLALQLLCRRIDLEQHPEIAKEALKYVEENPAAWPAAVALHQRFLNFGSYQSGNPTVELLEGIMAKAKLPAGALLLAKTHKVTTTGAMRRQFGSPDLLSTAKTFAAHGEPGVLTWLLAAYPFAEEQTQHWIEGVVICTEPESARAELADDNQQWLLFEWLHAGQLLSHDGYAVYRYRRYFRPKPPHARSAQRAPAATYPLRKGPPNAELVAWCQQLAHESKAAFFRQTPSEWLTVELQAPERPTPVGEPLEMRAVLRNNADRDVILTQSLPESGQPDSLAVDIRDPMHGSLREVKTGTGRGTLVKKRIAAGGELELELAPLTSFVPKYIGTHRVRISTYVQFSPQRRTANERVDTISYALVSNVIEFKALPKAGGKFELPLEPGKLVRLSGVRDITAGPDGRLWRQQSETLVPLARTLRRELIEQQFAAQSPEIWGAKIALLQADRSWFFADERTLLGYDGQQWVEKTLPPDRRFTGSCPVPGGLQMGQDNLHFDGADWFLDSAGVHRYDGNEWTYQQIGTPPKQAKIPLRVEQPRMVVNRAAQKVIAYAPGAPWYFAWEKGHWMPHRIPGICRELAIDRDGIVWMVSSDSEIAPLSPLPQEELPRYEKLVEQLADDVFEVRKRATQELIDLGPRIRARLTKSLADAKDPETRVRLNMVLKTLGQQGGDNGPVSLSDFLAQRVFVDEQGWLYVSGKMKDGLETTGPAHLIYRGHGDVQPRLSSAFACLPFDPFGQHDRPIRVGDTLYSAVPGSAIQFDLKTGVTTDLRKGLPATEVGHLRAALPDGQLIFSSNIPSTENTKLAVFTPAVTK